MIYIFLGAPGTGKGTISSYLVDNNGFKHISTGNIFREIISSKSDLGIKLKGILDAGQLVNDELTFEVLKEGLKKYNLKEDKIILDGFPRTINQANLLEEFFEKENLKIEKVINFVLDEEIIVERLSGRLICPICSKTYHKFLNKPKREWFCDDDNSELVERADDAKDKIVERLKNYENQTKPLINFYGDRKILFNLNANRTIEEISEELVK